MLDNRTRIFTDLTDKRGFSLIHQS